ncbi:hypothetical protein IPZ58_11950 [Streptomyces roseoverticillatus]|uniref:hypothetical protein n=1 Tax=Streptomyces roseoverticillatus TaxID=66429 RepID=UPI001F3C2C6F|nr:hypothetical protein [Streptomyces roseoverticillatus]MCF3102296.1 hypothetical protein [Streptomyces roseoverticillatus]
MPPLIITASQFDPALHGEPFIDAFCSRLGVADEDHGTPVTYLISTTMDPWMTDTESGDFIPVLVDALRGTVLECMREMKLLG